MKTAYYVIAALTLATAGAAFGADDAATTATAASAATTAQTQAVVVKPHALTRAEVQAQVIEARRNGTLIETEADMDVARTKQQVAP